jgi:RNA polymerase sigma factor (sigma-70 family)
MPETIEFACSRDPRDRNPSSSAADDYLRHGERRVSASAGSRRWILALRKFDRIDVPILAGREGRRSISAFVLCDSIPHDPQDTPLFLCLRGEMKQQLARAIAELPEKERQVLVLYYFQELTMKEVGAKLGVGESRVSQIHSTAVGRLRAVVILDSSKPSDAACLLAWGLT